MQLSRRVLLVTALLGAPLRAHAQDQLERNRELGEVMLDVVDRELHKNFYDSTFHGAPFDALYDSAQTEIKAATTNSQIFGIIGKLAMSLDDSHTRFWPPARAADIKYGWDMMMIGDSAYLTQVDSGSDAAAQGLHRGDRVVAIDGYRPERHHFFDLLYVLRALQPRPAVTLEVESPTGAVRTVTVATHIVPGRKLYDISGYSGTGDIGGLIRDYERVEREARSRFFTVGDSVLIWRLPSFSVSRSDIREGLGRARRYPDLIIDIRGNGGGYGQAVLTLLDAFAPDSDDGRLVDVIVRREDRDSLIVHPKDEKHYGGKVVVLVDGSSYSAAEMFPDAVERLGLGTVIGDRTGGMLTAARFFTYGTPGYVQEIYGISIAVGDVREPTGTRVEGVGVTPDEIILPTPDDLAAGRDPVLSRALWIMGMPVSPAAAGLLRAKWTESH